MAAVTERERRSTAGKRLTFLTGQAAENDEAFWGHETWKDDDDESGNESFHSSDEDSEVKRDQFDSDFDESESDHEDEEEAAGAAEERELMELERKNKRKQNQAGYMELSSAGRSLLVKQQPVAKRTKHVKGKRLIGDGLNAGIVLNLPPPGHAQALAVVPGIAPSTHLRASGTGASTVPLPPPPAPAPSKHSAARNRSTGPSLATTRKRRGATSAYGPRDRAAKHVTTDQQDASKLNSSPSANKQTTQTGRAQSSTSKERFSQEDLLLEAVQQTEPKNLRWLLGRKRHQAEKDTKEGAASRETNDRVVEKFVSRRGYLNTITFPDMDHVPRLLQQSPSLTAPAIGTHPTVCVITGKPARYRDPKTGHGYHDVAAFRELRRRLEANEPLDQRTNKNMSKKKPALHTNGEDDEKQAASASVANGKSQSRGLVHEASNGPGPPELSASLSSPPSQNHTTEKTHVRGAVTRFPNGGGANPTSSYPKPPDITSDISSDPAGTQSQFTECAPTQQPADGLAAAGSSATCPPVLAHSAEIDVISSQAKNVVNVSDVGSGPAGDGSRRSPRRRKPSSKILENEQLHLQQQQQQQQQQQAMDSSAVEEVYYNSKPT